MKALPLECEFEVRLIILELRGINNFDGPGLSVLFDKIRLSLLLALEQVLLAVELQEKLVAPTNINEPS